LWGLGVTGLFAVLLGALPYLGLPLRLDAPARFLISEKAE
jgi:hypothetical protein